MFKLKPISKAGIPEALKKAERYRLLNEPRLSESICEDILDVDPGNQQALVTMLLAITDQFGRYSAVTINKARQLLPLLKDEYDRHYYAGIICERQGSALLDLGASGGGHSPYEWLTEAMESFEKAEAIRSSGNDDAILRWNTCVRLIESHHLQPQRELYVEPPLE